MRASLRFLTSGFTRAAALSVISLTLNACGGSERVCTPSDEPYASARNNEPLHVPPGMTAPNRSEALAIPDARTSPNRSGRTSCLDEPPSYFRSAGAVARSPEEVVASWAHAWASREADAVIALYSTSFKTPTDAAGASTWLEQRREQVATGPAPDSLVEGLIIEPDGPDRRIAKFVQKFGANSLRKELTLVRESGSWRIVEEKVAAVK
ncbi:MAG TPA: hypothetical protein VHK24_07270 [Steroidobacter sp.]|jgi:hypothetical protein|nr:hypothetical protein [Steroidobacter sp.]